jgi:hypothetical protein
MIFDNLRQKRTDSQVLLVALSDHLLLIPQKIHLLQAVEGIGQHHQDLLLLSLTVGNRLSNDLQKQMLGVWYVLADEEVEESAIEAGYSLQELDQLAHLGPLIELS